MANKESGKILTRSLRVREFGDVILLDAVADAGEAVLFFKSHTPQDDIDVGAGADLQDQRSIGEAPILRLDAEGAVSLTVSGKQISLTPGAAETDLFAGLNVGVAVRNGERAQAALDWLTYHVTHHGMQAALIINRAEPGTNKGFRKTLLQGAKKIAGLQRLVLLDASVPLGQPELGAESHPMNVPGAPGKDRMDHPEPDAWTAPLGELGLYELARARFLGTARAVMNLDIYDLLELTDGPHLFDRAVASSTGCIQLEGRQCYPWRVRKGDHPVFGDHICVQFDARKTRNRWCVAPETAAKGCVWRLIRVVGTGPAPDEVAPFYRFMALRHPTESVATIVPKTSLIEHQPLIDMARDIFEHKPVPTPEEKLDRSGVKHGHTVIVTTMKNEGPFILEWLAYHRAIGVDDFLIYTNDCDDGTDTMLMMLQDKGIVQHRENPFRDSGLKPQHAALQAAEDEPQIQKADWAICMDVDEFINIHVGDGTLDDLFNAVGDANMIAITWRLFGNSDIHEYEDQPIIEAFTRCAPEFCRKPHQAWGFKTLFRSQGIFKKLGVHRPKGLKPQLWEKIRWVNGSGQPLPKTMYRNGWRSTTDTYGYDLVTLNHYAVRSAESFLVKRDRGRVNHVDRDQGLAYWFRMNNNTEVDTSIHRMLPAFQTERDKLMADPDIAAAHAYSVGKHREKIDALRETDNYAAFYAELTSPRLERLSRLHAHFGANVFLSGPEVVPDEVLARDPNEKFFFTVERGKTEH